MRRSLSHSPSCSPSRYRRSRYGRRSRSTRTPMTRYRRSRSVTPTRWRSVSLTPSGTHSSRSPPPPQAGRYRRTGHRPRSYTSIRSRSTTFLPSPSPPPSPHQPSQQPPPTQPITTVVIGPGSAGAAPTFVGYDPEHGRRSNAVPIPRLASGEYEKPEPQMRTGARICQWPFSPREITHLHPSRATKSS